MIMIDPKMPRILRSEFYRDHARILCASYQQWTSQRLLDIDPQSDGLVERLFHAPFGLVSHGTEADPIFNFGNAAALKLFETSWEAFTRLPSRESAEPISRKERAALLERVSSEGFIDDYRGIRISASGRRFIIEQATVWNLVDASGRPWGQAAKLDRWSYL